MSNSKHNNHPPPPSPPSLFSLPNEIVLSWLARVPKIYHLNLSWVSKNLRALVRSLPEHKGLRSVPHKSSLYLCFREDGNSSFHWLTLTTTTTEDYGLNLNPTPFPSLLILSTVLQPSQLGQRSSSSAPDLENLPLFYGSLIHDLGYMTQGPSMSVPRVGRDAAVGVIDGKIYVIGGGGFHDEIEVEVFDPKSETWELAGVEYGRKALRCSASVERKVYMVENNEIDVYNPREGERERMVHMVSKTLAEGGRKDRLKNVTVGCVCGVEDVFFVCFDWNGIMWFDKKRNVWRRLVGGWEKRLFFSVKALAEHDGKLAVLYLYHRYENDSPITRGVWCELVSLHRAGHRICGTVDWSGIAGTVPSSFGFLHCLAVSN